MATKPSALVDTRVIYCGDWHASFYVKVLARLVVMGLVLPISSAFGARAEIEEELQRLPVPVETKSDETDFALNDMRKALAPVHPAKKQAARVIESKDKPYILYGDLFHTGRNYALAELSEPDAYHQIGVGFAEWNGDKWEPRGLWHISPNWRPKGWKESDDDHLPITPAERPFWLMDFNGKGAIGVVMVGEVWKYWQENVLFKFDAKQHGLVPIEDAMGAPRFMHGWVRLYFNSGHRAIYEEWRFLRWNGDRFAERVSWHDETPYNDIDPPFIEVKHTDDQGKATTYKVVVKETSDPDKESTYTITRDEKPFAHITFNYAKTSGLSRVENDYLFEKLTGLPRKLYPSLEEAELSKNVEHFRGVHVKGEPDAVRMLSLKR